MQTQEAFLLVALTDYLHEFYFHGNKVEDRIKIVKGIYLLKVFSRALFNTSTLAFFGQNIILNFHH